MYENNRLTRGGRHGERKEHIQKRAAGDHPVHGAVGRSAHLLEVTGAHQLLDNNHIQDPAGVSCGADIRAAEVHLEGDIRTGEDPQGRG